MVIIFRVLQWLSLTRISSLAEQRFVSSKSFLGRFGPGVGRDLELGIDPWMVGKATVGLFILIVMVLGPPIPLGVKNLDRSSRAVQDMVDGARCNRILQFTGFLQGSHDQAIGPFIEVSPDNNAVSSIFCLDVLRQAFVF